MTGWRCENCGFTHLDERLQRNLPSRCPSCRSSRLAALSTYSNLPPEFQTLSPKERVADKSQPIYALLERLLSGTPQEQESVRQSLSLSGVHVLSLNERAGRLKDILSPGEARNYIALVEKEGYALAVVKGVVVAISPASPIRAHFGVSYSKLKELGDAAAEEA